MRSRTPARTPARIPARTPARTPARATVSARTPGSVKLTAKRLVKPRTVVQLKTPGLTRAGTPTSRLKPQGLRKTATRRLELGNDTAEMALDSGVLRTMTKPDRWVGLVKIRQAKPFSCYQYDPETKTYILQAPNNLLERDILYCACQVSNKLGREDPVEKIEKLVVLVANQYMKGEYSQRVSFNVIMKILSKLPCIPPDFFRNYIFNMNNDNMPPMLFDLPLQEAMVRLELMKKGEIKNCTIVEMKTTEFLNFFDYDNPETFVKKLIDMQEGIDYVQHPSKAVSNF